MVGLRGDIGTPVPRHPRHPRHPPTTTPTPPKPALDDPLCIDYSTLLIIQRLFGRVRGHPAGVGDGHYLSEGGRTD